MKLVKFNLFFSGACIFSASLSILAYFLTKQEEASLVSPVIQFLFSGVMLASTFYKLKFKSSHNILFLQYKNIIRIFYSYFILMIIWLYVNNT